MQRFITAFAGGVAPDEIHQVFIHEFDAVIFGDDIQKPLIPLQHGTVEGLTFAEMFFRFLEGRYIDERGNTATGFREHADLDEDIFYVAVAVFDPAFVFRRRLAAVAAPGIMVLLHPFAIITGNEVDPAHTAFDIGPPVAG